jgi:type II restriction/modification system DNA methylase subunit YeeA
VQWRRDKVQELCSKGYGQREISQVLQVGLATVNRDISYLRNQAKTNIKRYTNERLPETYGSFTKEVTESRTAVPSFGISTSHLNIKIPQNITPAPYTMRYFPF